MTLTEFLEEQAARGRKGGEINTFTSAVVTAQELVTGQRKLALAPCVASLKSAVRNDNPSLPRHGEEEMWDPTLVLTFWQANPPVSITAKRARAVSLLMLALYCRPSDLARFSPAHTLLEGDSLCYRIRGPKESRSARYLTPVQRLEMIPAEHEEASFACPVRALLSYQESISDLPRDPAGKHGIFYALRRDHGTGFIAPLGSERLSNI